MGCPLRGSAAHYQTQLTHISLGYLAAVIMFPLRLHGAVIFVMIYSRQFVCAVVILLALQCTVFIQMGG